jgi:hypothetical protein
MQSEALLQEIYRRRPDLYATQVLKQQWWSAQVEIAQALLKYKRVLVTASHSIGKSHLGGGLVNWHYDLYDPGLSMTTAPSKEQVIDVLWKEVRRQRGSRPGLQPKAPRMESNAEHFAVGYTAAKESSFQGRHDEHVLIMFDECVGIPGEFWEAAEGMMTGPGCLWLAICNPTDTSSQAYQEVLNGKFHIISVSALDHPNVAAELLGLPAPFPAAVRLEWVIGRIAEWCTPIPAADKRAGDVEFPPGGGIWFRPGPLFESRVLGRWPSTATNAVWSDAMWQGAQRQVPVPDEALQIGCDVARKGDDFTSIIVRRGACALHHETHNGWKTDQTAGRLKQLAREFAKKPIDAGYNRLAVAGEDPTKVLICVDDDGVGGGVTDQSGGYNFCGVGAGTKPLEPEGYPNRRSELWFAVAERALQGRLDVSRLSDESKRLLRSQLLSPTWRVDSQGRREVEKKDLTKERIKRSPDDADALNMAFTPPAWHKDGSMLEWLKTRQ